MHVRAPFRSLATVSRRTALFVIIAVLTLMSTIDRRSDAQTVTPLSSCQTISSSGSYLVTQDLSTGGDCFTIQANNVTIDGGSHTVTASGMLARITNRTGITIHHVSSNGEVQVYGETAGNVLIEHATVGGVAVYSADDITIRDSTLRYISSGSLDRALPVERLTIQRNTIQASDVLKMLFLVGGTTVENQNEFTCVRGDFLIEDNTITSNWPEAIGDEPLALTLRCVTHSIVRRNTITTTGKAVAFYLRDQSDYGLFEDNVIDVTQSWAGTIIFSGGMIACTQGTTGCPYGRPEPGDPAHNTFRRNVLRSHASANIYMDSSGAGNLFEYNVFYTNSANNLPNTVNTDTIKGAVGNSFLHNTFYRENAGAPITLASLESTATANTFRDNIFSWASGSAFGLDHSSCADMTTKYLASNNLFNNRSQSVSFGSCDASLAEWKAGAANRDANSIEANPLFSNPATYDFHIQSGSPARGAGTSGSDIGAYAFCTESWSCGDWSACIDNTETRTCTDADACGTTLQRPALSRACTTPDSMPPTAITDLATR